MKEFIPDKTGDALGSLKNEVADLVGGIDNFDIMNNTNMMVETFAVTP
jgi:hypothetical protein